MDKLRGHGCWREWHKAILVQLDVLGLRHLLCANLRPLSIAEHHQYLADQERAVQLLVTNISEPVLEKLWRYGWEITGATFQNTLGLLADLLAEPERHPQQSYEAHRDIVDLGRIILAPGSNGLNQYIRDAQQCHLRLLARYGDGNGSVEELLEHLFTSSVMEGLKTAQPNNYSEWMRELGQERRCAFVTHLVSYIKGPRVGSTAQYEHDAVLAGGRQRPRDWEREEWDRRRARQSANRKRAARRRLRRVPCHQRYRGNDYPDRYRPRYDDDMKMPEKYDRDHTIDEIL
ncbi:hypothetical protein V2A60_009951 [Cordyceps javanica]|uniref:Uncharacterized protein n=1 Tax=Cordyceps javanica TaxID=43265 RepID=A0A545UZS1_9HYPO|nr:hypothetical protein IF1G_05958 [Cordyceps javanica]TQW05820.1 hypothetical protein IF2G_06942 [Cordyceps javanica]